MNPKGTSNLDPKLRETYERVMGTSFPAPSDSSQQTPVQSVNAPQTVASQEPPPPPPQPQQPIFTTSTVPEEPAPPPPSPMPDPASEMVQSPQVFKAEDPFATPPPPPTDVLAKSAVPASPLDKKKNKMMPILLGVGGTVFFIAYAVVWAKVFGLF